MMKLWLDDVRSPLNRRIQEEFGAEPDMVWVKTANRAIQQLNGGGVTFISLDHDLGPGAGTGYDVAKWIEEQAFYNRIPRLEWTIHSTNVPGSARMAQAMLKAEEYWSQHEKS